MHLIRRAALRAASSPSTSFITKSRSLNTATPFVLRSKSQSPLVSSVFRRFNSDEASNEKSSIKSADGESGSVREAVESATESASTYASEAAESFSESVGSARDAVSDAAAVGTAAAGAYTPREPRQNSSYGRNDRGGSADRYGGDRNASRGFRGDEAPPEPSNGIYVGNLVFDVTAADLEREFGSFGTIHRVTVATDARGLSKGFGYIEFDSVDQAAKAIEQKHQALLDGRTLVVNYMKRNSGRPREQSEPTKTLFIGNLAFEMSDADLNKLFRDIKNVIDVRVAIDRRTGQPRGFAHADFVDVESAIKGMAVLSDKEVYGRKLRLDYSAGTSSGRGDGAPRSGGYGGNRGGDRGGDRGGRGGGYGGGDRRGGGGGGYGGDRGSSF